MPNTWFNKYAMDHLPSEFRSLTVDEQIRVVKISLSLDPILTDIASKQCDSSPQYWIAQGYDIAMKECASSTQMKLLELSNEKDKEISKMEIKHSELIHKAQGYDRVLSEKDKLNEDVLSLRKQLNEINVVKSSHAIGVEGENTTESILRDLPDYDCKETKKIPHSGDFQMTKNGMTILIDAKKYTKSVGADQRTNIKKVVDCNKHINGGILLSLTSAIATKKNYDCDYTPGGKPIIYLTLKDISITVHKNVIEATLVMITRLIELKSDDERKELLEQLAGGLSVTDDLLSESSKQIATIRAHLDSLNKSHDKLLEQKRILTVRVLS